MFYAWDVGGLTKWLTRFVSKREKGPTLLEHGYLTTINGDFSWFNNGLTMVKNGMIMGYTQPGYD